MGGEPKCPCTLPQVHVVLAGAGYQSTVESVVMTVELPSTPRVCRPHRLTIGRTLPVGDDRE